MAAAATPEYGKSISKVEGTFEGRVISRHSFLGVGQFSRFPEFLVLLSEEGRILAITRCLTRPGPCTKTRHKGKSNDTKTNIFSQFPYTGTGDIMGRDHVMQCADSCVEQSPHLSVDRST